MQKDKQLFTAALWDTNLLKGCICVMMKQMSTHALLLDKPEQFQTTAIKMHSRFCNLLAAPVIALLLTRMANMRGQSGKGHLYLRRLRCTLRMWCCRLNVVEK